jgi:hypothetical protein
VRFRTALKQKLSAKSASSVIPVIRVFVPLWQNFQPNAQVKTCALKKN